jgi:hypothetical protein
MPIYSRINPAAMKPGSIWTPGGGCLKYNRFIARDCPPQRLTRLPIQRPIAVKINIADFQNAS